MSDEERTEVGTEIEKADEDKPEKPESIDLGKTKKHTLDVASGTIAGELPAGHIDADGKLHRDFVAKEMTGHEEDILAGTGKVMPRLNQVITNCLVSLGDITDRKTLSKAVSEMVAVDRIVVLMAIRRASLGDLWVRRVSCPKCDKENTFRVDLHKMDVRPMAEPMQRTYETVLSSGKVIEWHVMSAEDEEWLTKKAKAQEDVLTLGLMARVDKVDDDVINREREYKKALRLLKGLRLVERREIRKATQEHEGSVDTTVEFECDFCGHEWKAEMSIGHPDFFFPSE
jgi:hypothetical protein